MYQALYRRYRPTSFDKLMGQEHIVTVLKNQIKNDNIGHAYLFSGTRGTGKTSAAKILSRAVNCLSPIDGNPCNTCENCLEILQDRTMDVIEMDAASYNSVDDVRDLRDKVVYLPAKIKYKVYIMDEVHMLSTSAFNALLKILEEPPKHLIFILATTEPEKVPATVLSRCQRFDFRRISNKDLVENMKNILDDLGIKAEDRALNIIGKNSDGAMRDALSLLDKCVAYSENEITYEDTINILGIANKDLIFNLVNQIKAKDIGATLKSIDEIHEAGKSASQFMKDLINHYRDLMLVKSTKDLNKLEDISDIDAYIDQAKDMEINYIIRALEILTNSEAQGKWSSEQRLVLEMAVIKLVNIDEIMNLEARIKALEEGFVPQKEKTKPVRENIQLQDKPKAKIEKEPIIPVPEIVDDGRDLSLEDIERSWDHVLKEVRSKAVRIHAFLMEGEVLSYRNNLLTIGYKDALGFHQQAINTPERKEVVENVVSSYFNKNIKINFIMSNEIKEKTTKEPESLEIDKDQAIKEVVDFFGEDIVEIIEEEGEV